MRHARRQKEDPLAGIEDMLSSLCGAQSSRIDTRGSDEEVGQGDNQNVSQAEKSPSGDDEGLTTPEIIPSSKPRQRKMAGGMRRRSNGLKRNPPAQRIRKSQKGKTNRQPGVRSAFQSARLGDFVDDEKQDNDVIGTSSDEQENAIFLNQMKLLAEEHLNANQRKNDAMNTRTVNAMKRHTDECVQRMKQIAGKVSGDIIRQASALEDVLPSDIKEESDITMNAIKSANDGLSNLLSQAKSFEEHLGKLVHQVHEHRKENKEKHDEEQQKLRENAARVTESGELLTSVLQKIDDMIDLDQFQ